MVNPLKINSFSAPIISTKTKSLRFSVASNLSSGGSPSTFQISNKPLASFQRSTVFFDASLTISELFMLGELSPVEPINQLERFHYRRSRSDSRNLKIFSQISCKRLSSGLEIQKLCPFSIIHEIDEDDGRRRVNSKNEFNSVKLQDAPIEKFKKRRQRCALNDEVVEDEVIQGEIKRYSLANRSGNLCFNTDKKMAIFEDDLVTSAVNLNKFKRMVQKKQKISVKFQVKKGFREGKVVLKPVNIKIED